MPIITLTTDWGTKDHYLASVKGFIHKQIPGATIIDITHEIPPFDIYQTSFVLKSCISNFPEGTIHLIGVNSDASIESPHTLVEYKNQYFIGSDNGIFSLIFSEEPRRVVELEIYQDSDKYTFSTRDVFIKAAQHIAQGKDIELLGIKKEGIKQLMSFEPVIEKDSYGNTSLVGKVIYLDRYENAIININEALFKKYVGGKKFTLSFNSFNNAVKEISNSYSDVPISEILALFDSNGWLEIAINQGNAGSLLALHLDSRVRLTITNL